MTLKQFSLWFSAVVIFALAVNIVFLAMIKSSYDSVVEAQSLRQSEMSLASGLRQESEQLSNLARAYTSTGQARYLKYYNTVLAIQLGQLQKPAKYDPVTYWDSVIAEEKQPQFNRQIEKVTSLAERIHSLGFSSEERRMFVGIVAANSEMRNLDKAAFFAAQGFYDPKTNQYVEQSPISLALANQLVYSQKYNQIKSTFSKSVTELIAAVDARTNESVTYASEDLERWIYFTLCVVAVSFAMVIVAFQVIRRHVVKPLDELSKIAAQLASGDYTGRTGYRKLASTFDPATKSQIKERINGVDELIMLGTTLDMMAESIENDMHLLKQKARLAVIDGLTGLANRRKFDEFLSVEYARHLRSGEELSIILLDIDHFKAYNDTYGHVAGDECLRQVAGAIKGVMVRVTDLAARYGGEEFVCILPSTNQAGAVMVAENIRMAIMSLDVEHRASSAAKCVTASMGVITCRCTQDMQALDMVTKADEQLYKAKAGGRNRVEC